MKVSIRTLLTVGLGPVFVAAPSIALAALLALLLSACGREQPAPKSERVSEAELALVAIPADSGFVFSFDVRASPQQDARQYQSLLAYLGERTGYTFALRFTPRDGALADELGQGRIHLAAVGAVTYLQAAAKQPAVLPLVRGKNQQNEARYRAYLVVRPDSPIQRVTDLRGRRLAFGARDSTQGHLIPRILLAQQGLALDQLAHYEYTGSHQNCADAVVSGRFDACGLQDALAERLVGDKLLRVLHRSGPYPSSGIVAGPGLPADAREKIKQALLEFDPLGRDKPGLHQWERTEMPNGFVAASAGDYDPLKQWLTRLDLLGAKPGKPQ